MGTSNQPLRPAAEQERKVCRAGPSALGLLCIVGLLSGSLNDGQLFGQGLMNQEPIDQETERQTEDKQEAQPAELLPQKPVAGRRGIEVESQLVLVSNPEAPVNLSFTHIYPDRTRFKQESSLEQGMGAVRIFRAGQQAWALDPRSPGSRSLESFELQRNLLTLELRRAAFLWPHGFEWATSEQKDVAEVQLTFASNVESHLGGLVAHLDSDGNPVRLVVFDATGVEIEALQVEARDELGFPKVLLLENSGQVIGRETITSHRYDILFHDDYFVPPDKRDSQGAARMRLVRTMDLQAVSIKRIKIQGELDWSQAKALRAKLGREVGQELAGGEHELDPRGCFEVDWMGAPTAVLLRLKVAINKPPKGWTTLGDRPGSGMPIKHLTQLDKTLLKSLRSAIPADALPGAPYVLLPESGRFEANAFVSYALAR